jgi:hypothetical protein
MRYSIRGQGGLSCVVEDAEGRFATWEEAQRRLWFLLNRAHTRATERLQAAAAATTFEEYRDAERQLDAGRRQTSP